MFVNIAKSKQVGVTMVELVITIVILSVALLAVVSVYSRAVQRSADPVIYARSVELGQAYLDEILTKKYDHNTPVGGSPPVSNSAPLYSTSLGHDTGESATDRSTYNDVDDYAGKTYNSLEFITGDNFHQYTNFQVRIEVNYIDVDPPNSELATLGLSEQNVKRIDVIVTNPLGDTLTFTGYKGNF